MKNSVLFLTNNKNTDPLFKWLRKRTDICFKLERQVKLEHVRNFDWLISYNYRHRIPLAVIRFFKGRAINLHTSLLPYNRGADPNFWAFIDNKPHGVTIHKIAEAFDAGEIIIQKELFFNPDKETLTSSYKKLQKSIQKLFKKYWKVRNDITSHEQDHRKSTYHFSSEIYNFKKRLGDKFYKYKVSEIIEYYEGRKGL